MSSIPEVKVPRTLVYGLAGWAVDSLWRRRPSPPLNVPVYALARPLFEPAHDRLRGRPLALRAAFYGAGILGVEYASGRALRRLVGEAPWDYGNGKLVRLEYFPLWALFGLGLEKLDDALRGPIPDAMMAGVPDVTVERLDVVPVGIE